jgi:hypothetical protein
MSIRAWLFRAVFTGAKPRLDQMRHGPLLALTALLAVVWKFLVQLDKVYDDGFWRALFGQHPLHELGSRGLIMLVLYAPGAIGWWIVTALLLGSARSGRGEWD